MHFAPNWSHKDLHAKNVVNRNKYEKEKISKQEVKILKKKEFSNNISVGIRKHKRCFK